jgi:hypothetical protein
MRHLKRLLIAVVLRSIPALNDIHKQNIIATTNPSLEACELYKSSSVEIYWINQAQSRLKFPE